MIAATTDQNELLKAIDEPVSQLSGLMSSLEENEVNTVPYKGSWTAGQLLRHVTKSTGGIAQAMCMDAKPAKRDPGERIPELKKTFLDFSIKMQSPDAIVPGKGPYEKGAAIKALNDSFNALKENSNNADLSDIIDSLPFGPTTKLELLHFVLYHTMRHLHQMERICDALKKK